MRSVRWTCSLSWSRFQGGPLVRAYLDETGFPWPILIDEQRLEVYRAYGMFKAQLRDLWGPATWWDPPPTPRSSSVAAFHDGLWSEIPLKGWGCAGRSWRRCAIPPCRARDQQIAPRLRDSYKSGTALSRQRLNKQVIHDLDFCVSPGP